MGAIINQNELNANQDLLNELDELDMIPGQKDFEDTETLLEEEDSSNVDEEDTSTTEDTHQEEDEESEEDAERYDEDGAEESEEEDQEETGADDQDQTPDTDTLAHQDLINMINEQNKTITELQAKLNGQQQSVSQPQEDQPKQEVVKPIKSVTPITFNEDHDFFGDVDPEEVFENKTEANKFLRNFANKVSQLTMQQTMLSVPDIMRHQIEQQINIRNTVDGFFAENPDLKPIRATVAQVCNKVQAEHSDWTIEQVFNEAGKKTREMLKMVKVHKKSKQDNASNIETDSNKTKIGKQSSRKAMSKKKKKFSGHSQQDQIDEL